MNNFSKIIDTFQSKYPELSDLKVRIDQKDVKFDSFGNLMPFLTYTNTLDDQNRIIFLTHSRNSEHYKLLPTYILLSVLKKQIQNLNSESLLELNGIDIIYKGTICKIIKVDVDQHKVITNNSRRKKIGFSDFITFDVRALKEADKSKLKKYKGKISLYESQKTSSIYDLLTCVNSLNTKPKGGLLLFTGKSKFELLLETIEIGNNKRVHPIKKWIPIQKAIYKKSKKNYSYKWFTEFKDKFPIVIYADYTDIAAIDIFLNKYDYLDTVVFDDADKGNNTFRIKEHLHHYKRLQKTSELRDIYIISSITSRDFHNEFEKEKSNNFNWSSLYNIDYSKYLDHIELNLIDDDIINSCVSKQKELIDRLKGLNNYFEFKEIAHLFVTFHDLKRRLNTFYCPKSILQDINDYDDMLSEFSESSGMADMVEKLFSEIISNFKKLTESSNLKLQSLMRSISKVEVEARTFISSSNSNADDIKYLMGSLKLKPDMYRCYTDQKNLEKEIDKIYYLDFRNPISDLVFLEKVADNVSILLHRHESGYYKYKYSSNMNNVYRSVKKNRFSAVLNISDNLKISNLSIGVEKDVIQKKIESLDSLPSTQENSINDVLTELFANNSITNNSNSSKNESDILIWFSDGSFVETNKGADFYKADDSDIDNLSELKVQANELTEGDTVFIRGIENKSFREEIYDSIERSAYFRKKLHEAEKWRISLKNLINSLGLDRVHKLLARQGINVQKITVQNWESGNTILPNSISRLIDALNEFQKKFNSNSQRINKEITLKHARSIKKVIVKLPQLLLKKTISDEIDLKSFYLEDERLNELLSNLSDKVKVKQVQKIIKND